MLFTFYNFTRTFADQALKTFLYLPINVELLLVIKSQQKLTGFGEKMRPTILTPTMAPTFKNEPVCWFALQEDTQEDIRKLHWYGGGGVLGRKAITPQYHYLFKR